MECTLLPHKLALFMASQTLTERHKMAAFAASSAFTTFKLILNQLYQNLIKKTAARIFFLPLSVIGSCGAWVFFFCLWCFFAQGPPLTVKKKRKKRFTSVKARGNLFSVNSYLQISHRVNLLVPSHRSRQVRCRRPTEPEQ